MTDIHNSMLRVVYVLTNLGLVLFVFAKACTLCTLSNLSIVNVLAFFFLHERWPYCAPYCVRKTLCSVPFCIHSFFCHIYTIRTRDIVIITQQVYCIHNHIYFLFYRRIGKYLLIGIVQLEMEDSKKQKKKTILPCPLSASIITCLKCANNPDHPSTLCLSLYPTCPKGNWNPPKKIGTDPRSKPLSLLRDSCSYILINDSFWRGIHAEEACFCNRCFPWKFTWSLYLIFLPGMTFFRLRARTTEKVAKE